MKFFLLLFTVLVLLFPSSGSANPLKKSSSQLRIVDESIDPQLVLALDLVRADNSLNLVQKQQKLFKVVNSVFNQLCSKLKDDEILALRLVYGERMHRIPAELVQKIIENEVTSYELIKNINTEIEQTLINFQSSSQHLNTALTDEVNTYLSTSFKKKESVADQKVQTVEIPMAKNREQVGEVNKIFSDTTNKKAKESSHKNPSNHSLKTKNSASKSSVDETMEFVMLTNIFLN